MALKVGFVGVGGIAQRHLTYCQQRADVEIVGHADVVFERAEKAAAAFGGRAYDSHDKLYAAEKPEALVICTPPYAHGDIEAAACDLGIPFFVEKPVAVSMDLALRVQKAVERSGVATQVGYMYRFAEPVLKVRELLRRHQTAMVQAHYYMPGLPPPDWWPSLELGGGQLIEQATHMLDLGRFLAGDVVAVQGKAVRTRDWTPPAGFEPGDGMRFFDANFAIPDSTALILEYESGALGTLSCSLVPQAKWDNGFKVVADGLIVTIDGANASWAGDTEGSLEASPAWAGYVLGELLDVVKAGGNVTSVPYIEGVKSLAISIAGYESMNRGGGPVDPRELLGEACGCCCCGSGADLKQANLSGASLAGADLSGSDLLQANFTGANLAGADLSGSDLTQANFTGANLTGADLSGSDLSGANFTGCSLAGADLPEGDDG
jgi:predicted dehydrogenase